MKLIWNWVVANWYMVTAIAASPFTPFAWRRLKSIVSRINNRRMAWRTQTSEKLEGLGRSVDLILKQLYPNGGSSLADRVNQIADEIAIQTVQNYEILRRQNAATFRADNEGRFVHVSDGWVRLSGISFDESLGWGWTLGIDDDDRQRVLDEWRRCVSEIRPFSVSFRFRDGERVKCSAISIIRDCHIVGWLGSIEVVG